jgi:hypothetical protein
MVKGIQIIGILIGLYYLYKSYRMLKLRKADVREFLIWTFVGFALIIVSTYPDIVTYLFNLIGMSFRGNAIFTIGILISYLLLIHVITLNRELNYQISKLNEEIALLRYEIEKKK